MFTMNPGYSNRQNNNQTYVIDGTSPANVESAGSQADVGQASTARPVFEALPRQPIFQEIDFSHQVKLLQQRIPIEDHKKKTTVDIGKYEQAYRKYCGKLGFQCVEAFTGYIIDMLDFLDASDNLPMKAMAKTIKTKSSKEPRDTYDQVINLNLKIRTSALVDTYVIVQNGTASINDLFCLTNNEKTIRGSVESGHDSQNRPYSHLKLFWQMFDTGEATGYNPLPQRPDAMPDMNNEESASIPSITEQANDDSATVVIKNDIVEKHLIALETMDVKSEILADIKHEASNGNDNETMTETQISPSDSDFTVEDEDCAKKDTSRKNPVLSDDEGLEPAPSSSSFSEDEEWQPTTPKRKKKPLWQNSSIEKKRGNTRGRKPVKKVAKSIDKAKKKKVKKKDRTGKKSTESSEDEEWNEELLKERNARMKRERYEKHRLTYQAAQHDVSETEEELIDLLVNHKQLRRRMGKYVTHEVDIEHPLIRDYTYPERFSSRWGCHLCGYYGFTHQMITHLLYMHDEHLAYLNESMTEITANCNANIVAIESKSKSTVDDKKVKVCLMCGTHAYTKTEFMQHFKQHHSYPNAPNMFILDYVTNTSVYSAISDNMVEFDRFAGRFFCKVCEGLPLKWFDTKTVWEHIEVHQRRIKFCTACNAKFSTQEQMSQHIFSSHQEHQSFQQCLHCEFVTVNDIQLREHKVVKHPIQLICSIDQCGFTCFSERECRRHLIEVHLKIDPIHKACTPKLRGRNKPVNDNGSTEERGKVDIKCKLCPMTITGPASLDEQSQYNLIDGINQHLENYHVDYIATLPKSGFACKRCHRPFLRAVAVPHHKLFCHGPRKCPMEGCNSEFTLFLSLKGHIDSTHPEKKEHVCDYCGKNFVHRYCLTTHLRSAHVKKQPFVCEVCARPFARKDQVMIHMRTHTGEKPHKCDFCDFRGRQRNNILSHLKSKHKDLLHLLKSKR